MLNRLGADGIPTLAVFSPARPTEPIVLQGVWSQSTLIEQLETVAAENAEPVGSKARLTPATVLR
jgi:hypothetical protein